MAYASFYEKVELLYSNSRPPTEAIEDALEGGKVQEEGARVYIQRDIRAELIEQIAKYQIPQTHIARAIGRDLQGLNNFLHGRRALPYEQIERLLWLLDGKLDKSALYPANESEEDEA